MLTCFIDFKLHFKLLDFKLFEIKRSMFRAWELQKNLLVLLVIPWVCRKQENALQVLKFPLGLHVLDK